jgi:hypothetical protein
MIGALKRKIVKLAHLLVIVGINKPKRLPLTSSLIDNKNNEQQS